MDNRRGVYRKGLSSLYTPYYDILCSRLKDHWQPYCGLRTFAEQDKLWAKGRQTQSEAIVTYAKGGQSPHNYGCATDWAIFDGAKFYWPHPSDKIWLEYKNACKDIPIRWGGEFEHPDCPHNELAINARWPRVLEEFTKGNMVIAQQFIEKSIQKSLIPTYTIG